MSKRFSYVTLAALFLVLGCGGSESPELTTTGLDYSLQTAGPFQVGYTVLETSYVPPGTNDARIVPVFLWYPTEDVHNENAQPPTASPVYIDLFPDSDTIIDATPAEPVYSEGFPVIAYSHGHRGVPQGSWRLMRYFASHGWIALSVAHTGNLLTEGSAADNTPIEHWHHRALDVSAGLNALESALVLEPLVGKVNTTKVLLTGHSRGTYTTWALGGSQFDTNEIRTRCDAGNYPNGCSEAAIARFADGFQDPRIAAVMPTAGSGHREFFDGVQGRNAINLPVLMLTVADDPVGAQDLYESTTLSDFTWIEIAGGCHELFNLGCGRSEDAAKFPTITTYGLAFGRRHILNDTSDHTVGILANTVEVSEHLTRFEIQ